MRKSIVVAAAAVFMTSSFSAFAAKPTAITFESSGTTPDGAEYANYIVRCSNGQKQPLTAWDNRKKWCVGAQSQENCHRKQIKAAKTACRAM